MNVVFICGVYLVALSALNLELVGAFDLLAGDVSVSNLSEIKKQALVHWRYFYDIPEMQTCIKVSGNSQLHYGYFRYGRAVCAVPFVSLFCYRDSPSELPVFVVGNDCAKNSTLEVVGTNLFAAA